MPPEAERFLRFVRRYHLTHARYTCHGGGHCSETGFLLAVPLSVE